METTPHLHFKMNHYGFACNRIEESIPVVVSLCDIKKIGEIYYDPAQKVRVCLLFSDAFCIELVEGETVKYIVSFR